VEQTRAMVTGRPTPAQDTGGWMMGKACCRKSGDESAAGMQALASLAVIVGLKEVGPQALSALVGAVIGGRQVSCKVWEGAVVCGLKPGPCSD
jgi:hypothetical protein